ncbi:hypothetical protein [Bradyrhizobium sp. WSM2254]|nr:hypothetical protein [Bradyrhizobium sp. WSM2254]
MANFDSDKPTVAATGAAAVNPFCSVIEKLHGASLRVLKVMAYVGQ